MNREQALHILDAHERIVEEHGYDSELATALREVILDAMTMQTQPIIMPTTQPWTGKSIVTWVNTGGTDG